MFDFEWRKSDKTSWLDSLVKTRSAMADGSLDNSLLTRQQTTTVQDLRDNRLADNSKKGYRSGLNQIAKWLASSGRASMVDDDGSIDLNEFGYADFTEFLLYKYKVAGVSLSTLSGYRSALRDYYNKSSIAPPPEFASDATIIFQGIYYVFYRMLDAWIRNTPSLCNRGPSWCHQSSNQAASPTSPLFGPMQSKHAIARRGVHTLVPCIVLEFDVPFKFNRDCSN